MDEAGHGRLPWWRPEDLDAEQRELYDRIAAGPRRSERVGAADPEGRLQGPFNAMLASPAIGGPMQELGAALRYRGSLGARSRELAILAVAADARSSFEWHAHEPPARAAGLSDADLDALAAHATPPGLVDDEPLVLEVTRALIAQRDLPDALFERARAQLGIAVVMELVALVGYYQLLALSLAVWRTPLPEGAADRFAA
jgi:4-carboxymuconolactone decarboxylase